MLTRETLELTDLRPPNRMTFSNACCNRAVVLFHLAASIASKLRFLHLLLAVNTTEILTKFLPGSADTHTALGGLV